MVQKIIHINQHIIKRNRKHGTDDPPITVKTYKKNTYCRSLKIDGPCELMYNPDNPLSCGAHVYIKTRSNVLMEGIEE
jgi:hypothetical protein